MENLIQQINEAKQKRAKVLKDQKDILKAARSESRQPNEEENKKYDKAERDFEDYDKEVRRLETIQKREQQLAMEQHEEKRGEETPKGEQRSDENKPEYGATFQKYLRYGTKEMSKEERSLLKSRFEAESRSQTVTTTGGGYAIPEGFAGTIEKIMSYYGPMVDGGVVRIMDTSSGNDLPYPTINDTSNKGRLLAINTAVTKTNMTFGQTVFNAYKYSSDSVLVPVELLEDEAVNLESVIGEILGERLGRIMNEHLTTGTGSSQPNGVVTASAAGKTAASATFITRDEIIDLIHSVDRAYRTGPNVGLMFHDSTLAAIKKLSIGSADDRPLWQASIREGEPDRLEGFQYWINNDMAEIATGNKTILFGDFSKYIFRRVANMRMRRLTERYADNDQVGFFGFMRMDGDLIASGAIKHLVQA